MELNKFEKQMQELREHPELRIPEHRRDVMLQEIVTWNGDKKQHIIVMEKLVEHTGRGSEIAGKSYPLK